MAVLKLSALTALAFAFALTGCDGEAKDEEGNWK
jgi:hypothetical protein